MSTTPGAYSNMLCGVNGPGGFFFKTYKGSEKVSLTCHLVFSLFVWPPEIGLPIVWAEHQPS